MGLLYRWYCKICQEYSRQGDEFWKSKPHTHDKHPNAFFQKHLNGDKHKAALATRQNVLSMLKRGNVIAQITQGASNTALAKRERNRRVLAKFFKTVYFMARKKWAIKNNFEDVVNFIAHGIGDDDLQKHLSESGKNATYLSQFTVDEYIGLISDLLETEVHAELLAGSDFSLLSDESTDEAGRAQLSIFVRYVDATTHQAVEKYVGIRKLV